MKAIAIAPKKISLSLAIITFVLTALSLLERLIGWTSGLFFLGADNNLPTWYASLALLIAAGLLSVIALEKRRVRDVYAKHWIWLAAIFYALSADEVAMVHERIGDAFKETSVQERISDFLTFTPALEGLFNYAWVLIAIPAVSLFLLSYLRFVLRLPRQVRLLFIVSAGLFLGGAIGVETLAGYQHYLNGYDTWTYALLTNLEEFLEKIGIVIFIHALLQYVTQYLGKIEISVGEEERLPVPITTAKTQKPVLR